MSETDSVADLRHALANPLAALLTEAQLALTGPTPLDSETLRTLQQIEMLALRMRAILLQRRAGGPPPANAPAQGN